MISPATGLEKYEILRELATSDFATTYKAGLRGTQKTVAVHALKPSPGTATDPTLILRAALAARALNSPYIVHVLEASESEGTVFVVTDYAEGSLLCDALGNAKLADWDLSDLSRQVCSALDHAASLNVSHPNLHPGNIIQEWDGTVKLMDYGITADVIQRAMAASTPSSLAALRYLSPEQARGLPGDRRSNIFSFGAILYEFVTGRPAFPGEKPAEIVEQIANVMPPPPHTVKGGVPQALSRIAMKALAKSPEERYQTGAELLHEIEHYKDQSASVPKPVLGKLVLLNDPGVAVTERPAFSVPPKATIAAPKPLTDPSVLKPLSQDPPRPQAAVSRTAKPSAPVSLPRPARAATPTAPTGTGLTPTPASEFIIVGKPFNPDEAPPPTSAPLPSAQPAQGQPTAKKGDRSSAPKKKTATILIASVSAVVLATVLVAGYALFRSRPHSAKDSPPSITVQNTESSQASAPEPEQVPDAANPDVPRKKKTATAPAITAPAAPVLCNLVISSAPDGASIELDGRQLQATTPHTAPGLQPGSHTVRFWKAGYDPVTQTISVDAGQTTRAHAQLAESRATVVINSDPEGALVAINGEKSNRSTPATVMLLKGKYIIALSKQGYVPSETVIEVAPGQSYKMLPHLSPLGNADAVKEPGKFKKLFGGGDRMEQMGKVQFRTEPKGATVSVNGKPMKKTTPMELFFPGGHYELQVSMRGYKSVQKTITVTENAAQIVEVKLERE